MNARLVLAVATTAAMSAPAFAQDDRREDVVRTTQNQFPGPRETEDQRRGWWVDVSLVGGYDNNPSLTARNDPREKGAGAFFGTAVSGYYRLFHEGPWTLAAQGAAFYSYPSGIPDFAVTAVRPGIGLDYRFAAFGVPMAAGFSYGLDAVWLGGDFFNLGHTLSWNVRFPVYPHFVVVPNYTLSVVDFAEDARDTVNHRIGLALRGPFRPMSFGRAEWSLDYGFARNNAGDLHAYDSYTIAAGLALGLRPGLLSLSRAAQSRIEAAIGYEHRGYTRYPTPPARRDDTVILSAAYATPIAERLHGRVALAHRIGGSNLAAFATRRTTLSVALTWRF
jgi:hypothetical protein